VQSWMTAEPLALPIAFAEVKRVDLEFVNVRRDNGSFTAFVYINAGTLAPADAGRDHERFAGSFSIFAPTHCWGVDDHCDWSKGPVSAFDRRSPHHLSPINVSMEVTDVIRRLDDPSELTVTIHAARRDDPDATEGVLRFERLTALAYQ
jgi:hypothetical protein